MNDIYQVLDELNIQYTKHEHPAVYTVDEAAKYYSKLEGGKSKNLFLRNKKGNKHYLVIVASQKSADLKNLAAALEESRLSFASPERLMKYLKLTPGSVSPFSLINDVNHEVEVVVDNDLLKCEKLHFHPNINTATVELSKDDFLRFLDWTGNKILYSKI